MSFTPTFVQSQEGDWYRSPPVLGAGDGRYWWMGWDAEEGIILAVSRDSPDDIYTILRLLKGVGWELKKKDSRSAKILFPPERGVGSLKKGTHYTLRQISGAPPGALIAGESLGKEDPEGEGVAFRRG